MDAGGVFVASTVVLGRRFGHYLLVALAPVVLTGALACAAVLVAQALPGLAPGVVLLVVVVRSLLALAGAAITMGLAEGDLLDEPRSLVAAATRTWRAVPRLGWLQALFGVVWAWPLYLWARLVAPLGPLSVVLLVLGVVVALPLLCWWCSRFLYVLPIAALQPGRGGGLAAYWDSWRATRHRSAQLLGQVLVWALAVVVLVLLCAPLAQRWWAGLFGPHRWLGTVVAQTATAAVLSVLGAWWQVYCLVSWAAGGRAALSDAGRAAPAG